MILKHNNGIINLTGKGSSLQLNTKDAKHVIIPHTDKQENIKLKPFLYFILGFIILAFVWAFYLYDFMKTDWKDENYKAWKKYQLKFK